MHCIYLGVSSLYITIDLVEQGREEPPDEEEALGVHGPKAMWMVHA
jgi:hypothetical protein